MHTARPFQRTLVNEGYASWDAGHTATVLVAPTGAGKTFMMSVIATEVNEPTCIIAHRGELVQQISMALARAGLRHNIIASEKTIKVIISQHIQEFGQSFYDRRAMLNVASVNTLMARHKTLAQWANMIRVWMIDECFPAGTLVDGKPIETLKVGDLVRAFDDHTGEVKISRINRVFKNKAPDELIDIKAGHHVIKATKGHPFYTQRGWVVAGEIKTSDRVLVETMPSMRQGCGADNGKSALWVPTPRSNLLQSELCVQLPRSKPETQETANNSHLFGLLRASTSRSCYRIEIREDRSSVLQQGLFRRIPQSGFLTNNGENEPQIYQQAYDRKQPDDVRNRAEEGIDDTQSDVTPTEDQRWERTTCNQGGNQTHDDVWGDGFCRTMHSFDRIARTWLSDTLQDRLWSSNHEDRNRSGRLQPHGIGSSGTGQSKGSILTWQRVESVSVHQRSDNERSVDDFVYNIEVDEFHTYIANGIVVHNCHHVLAQNQWGRATLMFPRARGFGFTASPIRCDRKSLHAAQGGVFTDMRVGPSMRELIDHGFLADYRIFGPPQSIKESDLKVGSTGDYTRGSLHQASEKSTITGDIVEHYLKIAGGKRGITFTVDVESANRTAQLFREAGVPAEAVSAKTPDTIRNEVIRKFQNGKILQLVNVDLFGEGFDVPAVEVVSMGRPTQSFGLYIQQFGRALRTLDGKSHGIIIDHVGNVKRHGLPDAVRGWKLEAEESGRRSVVKDPDVMPVTTCVSCFVAFEAITSTCPHCGHVREPESRSEPKFVDGDLIEFGPELLAELRAAASKIDSDFVPVPAHLRGTPAEGRLNRVHGQNQVAQSTLREAIALWAGVRRDGGMSDSEIYRRFFHTFEVDILSAQSLGASEAEALNAKITERYWV